MENSDSEIGKRVVIQPDDMVIDSNTLINYCCDRIQLTVVEEPNGEDSTQ